MNPDDAFGIGIFVFFVLAVGVFIYVAYMFMSKTGTKMKKGEKAIMIGSVVGVLLVLAYAIFAFLFKIII